MKRPGISPIRCGLALALLATGSTYAQTEASLGNFYTPSYRGQSGTASVVWDDRSASANSGFTNAYNAPNNATYVATGGNALANASITQTTSGAFIIPGTDPSGASGDIYSFSSANTFVLDYTGLFAVGNVVFQTETTGTPLDLSSVQLSYTLAGNTETLSASPTQLYLSSGDSGFGESDDIVTAWDWNLPLGDNITSFTINFNAAGSSDALERSMLDVANINTTEVVPEPGTFALAGIGGLGLFFWRRRCAS